MTSTSMSRWGVLALPSLQCPLPQPTLADDAKNMYDQVRREMPGLTPAAWRREAARRMGIDYNTFLAAWKSKKGTRVRPNPTPPPVGGTPKPPTPTPGPPKPPGVPGPGRVMTRDEARSLDRQVAKELGLKPGTAASRRAAAERAGMRYDDFLAAWKGEKPHIPTTPRPDPIPDPKPPTAPHVPDPPSGRVANNPSAITRYLEGKGWKKSTQTKERRTHTGQTYGGGVMDTEGFEVRAGFGSDVTVYYRPGFSSPEAARAAVAKLRNDLEAAGFRVTDGITPLQIRVSKAWSEPAPVRRVWDSNDAIIKSAATRKVPESNKLHGTALQEARDELEDQFRYSGSTAASEFKKMVHAAYDPVDRQYIVKNPNVIAYYRPAPYGNPVGTRQMYLGDSAMSSRATASQIGMERNRWFSQCQTHEHGSGLRATIAHEYGHFVDDIARRGGKMDEVINEMAKDMGLSKEDAYAWRYGHSDEVLNELGFSREGKLAVTNFISRYGSSNKFEAIAEVWAEYTKAGSKARPHIQKWGTMIQDILEDL